MSKGGKYLCFLCINELFNAFCQCDIYYAYFESSLVSAAQSFLLNLYLIGRIITSKWFKMVCHGVTVEVLIHTNDAGIVYIKTVCTLGPLTDPYISFS